jgi:hypothetical protein
MKAIVVVFFRKREADETRPRQLPIAAPAKKPTLPFWTWFIENPPRRRREESRR